MSKKIIVKYFEESEYAKVPTQATEGSAGYDLFTAESRTTLPRSCDTVSLDLRWAIPKEFYGKIYPCSSILKKHLVIVDAGLIDSDCRGIVEVLFINHSEKTFTMRTGDRVAQVIFVEQLDAKFEKITKKDLLGITKRGDGDFVSTGMSVIKKAKKDPISETEEQENFDEAVSKLDDKSIPTKFDASLGNKPVLLQVVEKPQDDLQIVSEEAIMNIDNEVVIKEKIAII